MNTEPLSRAPSERSTPRHNRSIDGQLLRVAAIFFAAVCTAAALFVLAALSLPGSARADDTVAAAGFTVREAGREALVAREHRLHR